MSEASRRPLADADELAARFVGLLAGTYDRLAVAGSIRRRRPTVGDVEIVAVPTLAAVDVRDLLGQLVAASPVDLLAERLEALVAEETLARRTRRDGKLVWGPKARAILFDGWSVDLYTPELDRFGWILVVRTGPAPFARQLVVDRGSRTKDGRPGLLPPTLRPRDGYLTDRVSGARIATPNERGVFELMGLDYLEPWERD